MNWIPLVREDQLDEIKTLSFQSFPAVIIFKHSTRCYISASAKKRLETEWAFPDTAIPAYFLDLLKFRDISNTIAMEFDVHHQSPQILLIKNGKCFYDASHSEVNVDNIKAAILHGEHPTSPFNL